MIGLAFETLPELTLLEETYLAQAIDQRRADRTLPCAFCGEPSLFHYVAHTMIPKRWMDVCGRHSLYLRGRGPL